MPEKKGHIIFVSGIEPNAGLKNALSKSRAEVIAEIRNSGLKGRGGAGFSTGVKWNLAAAADSAKKYVVCNADEGEPGTFKDRVLLSDYSNDLMEGITIAGYAVGAYLGIIYLRGEYRYLKKHIEETIRKRHEEGFLGKDAGSKKGFNFDIEIRMGSGAYVCGEETALIESLEGQRGEPRNRPPIPVNTGYLGCPTIVNNVETLVTAARIMEKGADWFKTYGLGKSTGSKLYSISGDCKRPGVYEFPIGITVSDLLIEVGGEDAKAAAIGGASGRVIPAKDFAKTVAFVDAPTGGSVIVFGKDRDMLDVAENFLEFFVDESCGQCTPCREGNSNLLDAVFKLQKGECSVAYLRTIEGLAETMQLASKCGLGQSSPNAFLSIIENFKHEIFGRMPL
ncbi:MAG: NADH-ubiquinone oxidoreductase-F iron-sulfur binding region domain-containing protein [Candidatus Latescibacter sp.]|nr:NADH-ubiquinone oxidoreductase-F iron-sulfur binding region domain-containing protein [Candidatus Latescibacter sp.]